MAKAARIGGKAPPLRACQVVKARVPPGARMRMLSVGREKEGMVVLLARLVWSYEKQGWGGGDDMRLCGKYTPFRAASESVTVW